MRYQIAVFIDSRCAVFMRFTDARSFHYAQASLRRRYRGWIDTRIDARKVS